MLLVCLASSMFLLPAAGAVVGLPLVLLLPLLLLLSYRLPCVPSSSSSDKQSASRRRWYTMRIANEGA